MLENKSKFSDFSAIIIATKVVSAIIKIPITNNTSFIVPQVLLRSELRAVWQRNPAKKNL